MRALDPTERLGLSRLERTIDAVGDELREAADRVERCPQLVAHRRQKLALRAVGRLGLGPRALGVRPRPFERRFGGFPIGDIAQHDNRAEWCDRCRRALGPVRTNAGEANVHGHASRSRSAQHHVRLRHDGVSAQDLFESLFERQAVAIGNDVGHVTEQMTHRARRRPAGELFRRAIQERDRTPCIRRDHRVADTPQRRRRPCLARLERALRVMQSHGGANGRIETLVAGSREHDDGDIDSEPAQLPEHLQTTLPRELLVEQHAVERARAEHRDGSVCAGHLLHVARERHVAERSLADEENRERALAWCGLRLANPHMSAPSRRHVTSHTSTAMQEPNPRPQGVVPSVLNRRLSS